MGGRYSIVLWLELQVGRRYFIFFSPAVLLPYSFFSSYLCPLFLGLFHSTLICQVVSVNKGPVHLHFIGTAKGNTGDFMTLDQQLHQLLPNLSELVYEVTSQAQGDT